MLKDNQLRQLAQQRREQIERYWPENIFLPTSEWYHAAKDVMESPEDMIRVGELSIRGPHRYTRSVYKFDPTLQESLMSTQLKGDLPCDLLLRLPEWTVFIDIDEGVYVALDHTPADAPVPPPVYDETGVLASPTPITEYELRILTGEDVAVIPLGPWSVAEAVDRLIDGLEIDHGRFDVAGAYSRMTYIAERYLPLIMYICSDGVDYPDRERPQRPQPVRTRRDGWKLFPAKRDRVWKLGERTGEAIRRGRRGATHSGRKGPAPHIRRAHWHTLRNGQVKFFPPIPVAQHATDELCC